MKILVTGGCGFIGSWLVRRALKAGHSVVNLDVLTYAANPDNLSDVCDNKNYEFIHGDICDGELVTELFTRTKPDAIIHLAAETHVDKSIDSASDFIKTNVLGTQILLDAATDYRNSLVGKRYDIFRFLHVSTDEVYGDLGPTDPAFSETTPYAPSSPYAASKASSDHLVRAWHRTHGLPILITNCSNNYGPNQFPEKLIPLVILRALADQEIPVYGTGENVRDWLYVQDHADAILTVLKDGCIGETYNVGGEEERTNLDLVKCLCAVLDDLRPRKQGSYVDLIKFISDRPGHDRRYAMNIKKISTELGWSPATDLQQGLERTIKWYLDNTDWWQRILDRNAVTERQGLGAK
ncbi:MAG: dTDP-glucose 4,6-dehydratase [Robiginitomaculum sp.]|nr:MAG: dTDP-glucose 4,6-dehydratase [Robiginitomaculum sp.]